jgi:hypothetical protein
MKKMDTRGDDSPSARPAMLASESHSERQNWDGAMLFGLAASETHSSDLHDELS